MKALRPTFRSLPSSTRQFSHSALPSRLSSPTGLSASTYIHQLQRPRRLASPLRFPASRRRESTASSAPPSTPAITTDPTSKPQQLDPTTPAYDLTFTCKPCGSRSTHRLSKQAYHFGAVLIKCPGCTNRHVMADHLGIFTDKGQGGTLDDILAMYGKGDGVGYLKKGHVEGDLEIWDDGTVQQRKMERESSQDNPHLEDRSSVPLGNKTQR